MKKLLLYGIISIFLFDAGMQGFCEEGSSFVSDQTIASVVRLGKTVDLYMVSGMPANYQVTVSFGIPNFGGGNVINKQRILYNLGSGVIVSEDGWIFTNAHVSDDWTQDSIQVVDQGFDAAGLPVKMVVIPTNPGYMWVTVASIENIRKSVRKVELKYLCQTLYYDSDYANYDRDRSVCKIISYAKMNNETKLPEVGTQWNNATDKVPFTNVGNPFDIPIRNPKLTSMGFPGIGAETFVTMSEGEFMNYDNDNRSYILHSAFISGGNSGGGIFYNDNLIGINTWDRADARGRNMSIAQPITYFAKPVSCCKLWYEKDFNTESIPTIDRKWILSDPAENDPYKNEVYLGFNIRSRVNENVAVKSGFLAVYKASVTTQQAFDYLQFRDYMDYFYIVQALISQGYGVDVIAPYLNMDISVVQAMANMTEAELVGSFTDEETKQLHEIYKSKEFYANYWNIDQWGQVLAALPPNTEIGVFVTSNGFADQTFTFKTTEDVYQGPQTIKMPMQ